jgi:DNA polymerase elongation subunit (family B)
MDKNNHNYYFYDLYNFLDTSLDKASKKFLKDEKLHVVDANKLNTDLQYWKDNNKIIKEYCCKDANLTKRLADYFWALIQSNLDFLPKMPMSKGKLSEEYFLLRCQIPAINVIPEKVIETAYNSFYGGRFELLKRGYYEKVYCYDISSAYPAVIAELPDFLKGEFKKVNEVTEDAYTGFYKCRVSGKEPHFSPFKLKLKAGLNIYANGNYTQWLAKEEIDFYRLHFPNSAISVEFGYEWYPKTVVKPLKEEIERLYAWKEKETDVDIKYCIKIIMNSLYGKFIQVSGDQNKTGRLFNPLYASLITAKTRIKILEMALQNPESIISFSTDSVISTEPLSYPKEPKLGDFKFEFFGEGVFVMSDVYNLWNDELKKQKSKLRGFSIASIKDSSNDEVYLKDILATMPEKRFDKKLKVEVDNSLYEYTTNRPYHLGECILHHKKHTVKDVNVFGLVEKSIDINGDNKRLWDKDFKNGKAVLKEQHDSLPLMVSE